jgi:MFS family permease
LEKVARENAGRDSTSMGKVAFASFIGTAIELSDFYIYGTAAALVLAGAFFARPVCGVVFGHFGGRVGRKALLIFSLLLMGVATFLIGLLAGYAAGLRYFWWLCASCRASALAMIAVAIMGLGVPVFAALSDRVGRRSLCLWAAALAGFWAFPLFWLIDTGSPILIALSFSVGMVIFVMLYGSMGAFLPELYGTRLRYSGAAVSYNLGGVFGGAFAPLIAGQLLASTGDTGLYPSMCWRWPR